MRKIHASMFATAGMFSAGLGVVRRGRRALFAATGYYDP